MRSALTMLADRALGWLLDGESIAVNPGVTLVITEPLDIGRTVAGHLEHTALERQRDIARNLGLPNGSRRLDLTEGIVAVLTDPTRVRALVDGAPAAARRRLTELARESADEPGFRSRNQQDLEGENWARRRGLLFGGHYYRSEMPVEVVLAIRQGEIAVNFDPDLPKVAVAPVPPQSLTSSAAAAATDFTETVAATVDLLTRAPVPGLKAGGIGSREVTKAGKALGIDERQLRLALELIRQLGLLTGAQGRVTTTPGAAAWRAAEPAARFADLAAAWWGATGDANHHPRRRRQADPRGRRPDGRRGGRRSGAPSSK